MYKIECVKCGHMRTVSQEWIVENVPNEIKGDNIIKWISEKLRCQECKSKFPNVVNITKKNKKIDRLLKQSSWLYQNEIAIIENMKSEVKKGKLLSIKQNHLLEEFFSRVQKRRSVKAIFFQGGSPGTGS